ncbi:hypothetical protein Tco_0276098 [Tanacetum coccineum]
MNLPGVLQKTHRTLLNGPFRLSGSSVHQRSDSAVSTAPTLLKIPCKRNSITQSSKSQLAEALEKHEDALNLKN